MKPFLLLCLSVLSRSFLVAQSADYAAIAGRRIGVWPDEWSVQRLTEFRTRYGFTGVVVDASPERYRNAVQAGFDSSSIMLAISFENHRYAVDSFPAAIYYIDEPAEHKCTGAPTASRLYTPEELAAVRSYIRQHRPTARFAISGYKRCSHNIIAASYADIMMYSSYVNWVELWPPVCRADFGWGDAYENPWIPAGDDQRGSWTAMRDVFGKKFSMTWMRGHGFLVGDEYEDLMAHADALGLEAVWLFNAQPVEDALLEQFCNAAVRVRWLQRVPRHNLYR